MTYRRGVIGLAKVAIDATGAGGINDPAVPLLQEIRPRRSGNAVCSAHVHGNDWIPDGIGHVDEGFVADESCVVDDDVDATVGIDCRLDDCSSVFYGVDACYGFAAALSDLLDDGAGLR